MRCNMKKTLLFAFLFCFVTLQLASAQSYETECISVEQDGSQTLRVWGKGRNRSDAVEQAKKDAVYEILFKGVKKGNTKDKHRPVVTEVNARERHSEYFDIFFMDDGEYLNYVSMADKKIGSTKKIKGTTQVRCCVTVRVLVSELRQRLTQDGVLQQKEN